MARPKKELQDKVAKDSFSGPIYLIQAAKIAAGVYTKGAEFSPWICEAIREKLKRDMPGLEDKARSVMRSEPTEFGAVLAGGGTGKHRRGVIRPEFKDEVEAKARELAEAIFQEAKNQDTNKATSA